MFCLYLKAVAASACVPWGGQQGMFQVLPRAVSTLTLEDGPAVTLRTPPAVHAASNIVVVNMWA